MAGKSDFLENAYLKIVFTAVATANIFDNAASSPITNIYCSLHTADPGDAGTQNTSEISYTGYARVAIARTAGGFTVTGNSVSPAGAVTFGAMTAGTGGTVTHAAYGQLASGAGNLFYVGPATPNQVVANGSIPIIGTASTATED